MQNSTKPKATPSNTTIDTKNAAGDADTKSITTIDIANDLTTRMAIDVAKVIAKDVAKIVVKESMKKAVKEADVETKFPPPSERLQRIAAPNAISYVSLYNNYSNVLKPEKKLHLEEKISDIRKYSQVIADEWKILIVDKTNGINRNQAAQLQMKIMECVNSYVATAAPPATSPIASNVTAPPPSPAPPQPSKLLSRQLSTSSTQPPTDPTNANAPAPNPQVPRLLEMTYVFKCLKVVCIDEFTVNWLKNIVANLSPPPWKGAKLEVTSMSFYSTASTLTSTMLNNRAPKTNQTEGLAKFFIPHTAQKLNFNEIVQRIDLCNATISTSSWKKYKEESDERGMLYYVAMSNDCLKEIRKLDCRLYYLIGILKIVIVRENIVVGVDNKVSRIDRSEILKNRAERAETRKKERGKFK